MAQVDFLDGWILRESDYKPEEESSRATIFALANGYMGTRGTGEELPASLPGEKGTYVNGVYDTPEGKLTEREVVCAPDWTDLRVEVDGEPMDLSQGELLEYSRELDMRKALMRRTIRWRSPSGKVVRVTTERFLSIVRVHLAAMKVVVEVEHDSQVVIRSGIDSAVNNRWADHFRALEADGDGYWCSVKAWTFDPGYEFHVLAAHQVFSPREMDAAPSVAVDGNSPRCVFSCAMKPGESLEVHKYASVCESRFVGSDLEVFNQKVISDAVSGMAFQHLLEEHAQRWAEIWRDSDVVIEGDPDAQMGIRFSLFHLLAAGPWHCDRVSIPARGLQGQDYYGSIFWDCEVFVLPLFAYTQPQVARNMLMYRVYTLDGAREKARRFGYEGAFFAWQSQEAGQEQCDLYVFDNPFTGEKIRSYFADEQIHISADIAYAACQYVRASGDTTFWLDGGAELLTEIARFFLSRATWDPGKGRHELLSVLGPDEYHERVNNNAYTNWLAVDCLSAAHKVLTWMQENHPDPFKALQDKIGLKQEELDSLQAAARTLHLPKPDPQTLLIEQFEGYFGLREEPMDLTRSRLAHPDLHKGGPLGPFQETQNIKQADVVMLLYLLRDRFSAEQKLANWRYYEPRTSHDSSLSPMAYSLVAADVGMLDWAYKYYIYASHIDLASYGPHWNLGIHAASLGGAWLSLVHGFSRLDLEEDGVHLRQWPALAQGWEKLEFGFCWHGVPMRFLRDRKGMELANLGQQDVPAKLPDGWVTIPAGQTLRRSLTSSS